MFVAVSIWVRRFSQNEVQPVVQLSSGEYNVCSSLFLFFNYFLLCRLTLKTQKLKEHKWNYVNKAKHVSYFTFFKVVTICTLDILSAS